MFSELSSRSPSEFEEKTQYNLRRISASEERNMIRMIELVTTDSDATQDSSRSNTDEERDDETDDSDDSDMDLSEDEPKGDDDAVGFRVFMC
ncbi:hypothetical protein Tco_0273214 [Tanacetum coccineum]